MGQIVTTGGSLDRRVQLQRYTVTGDNAFGEEVKSWTELATVWASYRPISDGERFRAGMVENQELARFAIRYSQTVSSLNGRDRLIYEGETWGILWVKEVTRKLFLEITAERMG